MTDELLEALTDASTAGSLGFRRLPRGFDKVLAQWSGSGPVAYVEVEFFGGDGEQRAAVRESGAVVLGPLHAEEGEPFPPAGSPVSQALRRLGARTSGAQDEFDAVGLGRHRFTESWIA